MNMDTARTMAWGGGQSSVATREVVTREGAVGGQLLHCRGSESGGAAN